MLRLPAYVQLEITDLCNLRCKFCYHFDTNEMPKSQDLDDEQTIRLVENILKAQVYSLTITGGEPLARFDLTCQAAELAKKLGVFVSINTNLTLLTPEKLTRLVSAGVNSLLVSCPASDPDVYRQMTRCGNYLQFRAKLKLLLEAKISCLINMVVTKNNHRLIRRTAREMAELGVKRFAVTPASLNVEHPDCEDLLTASEVIAVMEDLRWCEENLDLKIDMLEPLPKCLLPAWCWEKDYAFTRRACQAGRMSASISNTGAVRPCSHNPIVYGNLLDEPLEDIWGKMSIYRDGINGVVPVLCQQCPTVMLCNGACRTNALAMTGQLNQPDRLMTGHIAWPKQKPADAPIMADSVISLTGKLCWRKESNNTYSISSRSNGGNLIIVNEQLFHFVSWLEKTSPLNVAELTKNSSSSSDLPALMKILRMLIRKNFVTVS